MPSFTILGWLEKYNLGTEWHVSFFLYLIKDFLYFSQHNIQKWKFNIDFVFHSYSDEIRNAVKRFKKIN